MAFTRHGHQIIGTPAEADRPKQVARCGGPLLCGPCAVDSIRGLSEYQNKTYHWDNLEKTHWAENGDLVAAGLRFRRVAWLIHGGEDDGRFVKDLTEMTPGASLGGFFPVYIQVDTD